VPGTTSFVPATRSPSVENPRTPADVPAEVDRSAQQGVSKAMILGVLREIERTEQQARLIQSANEKSKNTYPPADVERLEIDRRYQLDLLKVLRAEAAARQKILELSLRKAKLKADAAVAEQARMHELHKRAAVSTNEVEKTHLEAESAKIDLEKAQLELDEHQKVLETFPSEPKADRNPTEDPLPEAAKP
jgi:hypothetical protein